MRLQQVRTTIYSLLSKQIAKDSEGVPVVTYGAPVALRGYRWNATSKRQIERYGDRIENVSNMRIEGQWTVGLIDGIICATEKDGRVVKLGDGIRVYSDSAPDYEVSELSTHDGLLTLEVVRRV